MSVQKLSYQIRVIFQRLSFQIPNDVRYWMGVEDDRTQRAIASAATVSDFC
jgi:hypothetical protein